MKKITHIGAYGVLINADKILLINKVGGPYNGKLDLPGGTIEFNETPEKAMIREFKEEVGVDVLDYKLLDGNSVNVEWVHKGELEQIHHIGFFYTINKYTGNIKRNIKITEVNDDSKGAAWYNINKLSRENISQLVILVLNKLGYLL